MEYMAVHGDVHGTKGFSRSAAMDELGLWTRRSA